MKSPEPKYLLALLAIFIVSRGSAQKQAIQKISDDASSLIRPITSKVKGFSFKKAIGRPRVSVTLSNVYNSTQFDAMGPAVNRPVATNSTDFSRIAVNAQIVAFKIPLNIGVGLLRTGNRVTINPFDINIGVDPSAMLNSYKGEALGLLQKEKDELIQSAFPEVAGIKDSLARFDKLKESVATKGFQDSLQFYKYLNYQSAIDSAKARIMPLADTLKDQVSSSMDTLKERAGIRQKMDSLNELAQTYERLNTYRNRADQLIQENKGKFQSINQAMELVKKAGSTTEVSNLLSGSGLKGKLKTPVLSGLKIGTFVIKPFNDFNQPIIATGLSVLRDFASMQAGLEVGFTNSRFSITSFKNPFDNAGLAIHPHLSTFIKNHSLKLDFLYLRSGIFHASLNNKSLYVVGATFKEKINDAFTVEANASYSTGALNTAVDSSRKTTSTVGQHFSVGAKLRWTSRKNGAFVNFSTQYKGQLYSSALDFSNDVPFAMRLDGGFVVGKVLRPSFYINYQFSPNTVRHPGELHSMQGSVALAARISKHIDLIGNYSPSVFIRTDSIIATRSVFHNAGITLQYVVTKGKISEMLSVGYTALTGSTSSSGTETLHTPSSQIHLFNLMNRVGIGRYSIDASGSVQVSPVISNGQVWNARLSGSGTFFKVLKVSVGAVFQHNNSFTGVGGENGIGCSLWKGRIFINQLTRVVKYSNASVPGIFSNSQIRFSF
ncbi:MAG: hypothetical protein U0T73_08605 [Chitinophagales bacterium]